METENSYNCRIVFNYWSPKLSEKKEVWRDLNNPVLFAIASMRRYNPTIPIDVIEDNAESNNWNHFPDRLSFNVVKVDCTFPDQPSYISHWSHRYARKVAMIWKYAQTIEEPNVIFADTDILWRSDPAEICPPTLDRYRGHFFNTGIYAFNTRSPMTKKFFNIYLTDIIATMLDKEKIFKVQDIYGYPSKLMPSRYDPWGNIHFSEEMVYLYLLHHRKIQSLMEFMPPECNYTPLDSNFDYNSKNCHFIGVVAGHEARAAFAYNVDEFYDACLPSIGEKWMNLIFKNAIHPARSFNVSNMHELYRKPKIRST